MKIVDNISTIFSYHIRSLWYVIQDMICLSACIGSMIVKFPFQSQANNLFMFFMGLNAIMFFYKIFRTDLYTNSVKLLGAWGIKYRCFYAIYYPVIAFLCASMGGFKGYTFALIWILSGGTYLVVADKIAKEENKKKEGVVQEIEKERKTIENSCPYCKSTNYKEKAIKTIKDINNIRRITNICENKDCKKEWVEIYEMVDIELQREDIPLNLDVARKVFS